MRIGITQRVELMNGERRDCLDRAWPELLTALGHFVFPLPNVPGSAERWLREAKLEALILSGGNDLGVASHAANVSAERDAFESELIELFRQKKLPVLGVCRGMQRLLTHFGVTLQQLTDHAGKPHTVTVEEWPGGTSRLTVNSFHNFGFQKKTIPPAWKVLASASDETVEAVRHATLPFWGIMWHPERPPELEANRTLLNTLFPTKIRRAA